MKKVLVAAGGLLLALTLAGCGNSAVVTTNAGKITQSAYYSSLKSTSSGQQVLQTMTLDKLLEKQYGKDVKSSEVTSQLNALKQQYGSQFQAALAQQGMTVSQVKQQLRSRLLLQAAVKANINITDAQLQQQFKTFQPKVTVNQILVPKKSTADTVISQLKSGKSFSSLAKKYSTDSATANKGGRIAPFDNTDTTLDSAFKKAAFALSNGQYTKTPVKTASGYQVIQMVNHPSKGNYKQHESELKNEIVQAKLQDPATVKTVISKVLKNGDVHVNDKDLQNVFNQYMSSSSSN